MHTKNENNNNQNNHFLNKIKNSRKKSDKPQVVLNGNYLRIKLSGSMLKFSSLYSNEKVFIKLIIISIVSVISALIGVIFVQNTGLYNVGFESFAQGVGRLASYLVTSENPMTNKELGYVVFNSLFWVLIIVVNIPLIIFGWYKIGKQFTIYTSIYIVLSSVIGLGLGFVKELESFFIFSDLKAESVYALNNVQIVEWNSSPDASRQLAIFIYGFIYGILQALCYSVLFIIGCSSGSLDFFVVWYAEKKYKDLGTIFTYCNILCFVISYVMGTYLPVSLTFQHVNDTIANGFTKESLPYWWPTDATESKALEDMYRSFQTTYETGTAPFALNIFFSPNFLSTIIMSIVLGMVINSYFPKYKMCRVEIHTKHASTIRDYLLDKGKPFSVSIYTIEGGYSRQPQNVLVTNCMFIDASSLLEIVREYDPNALFVVTLIRNVDGYLYVSTKEDEDIDVSSILNKIKSKIKINKNSEIEQPHQIELETDDQVINNEVIEVSEEQKIDDSTTYEVSETNARKLGVIEASEVYDKELVEKCKNKETNSKKEKNKCLSYLKKMVSYIDFKKQKDNQKE